MRVYTFYIPPSVRALDDAEAIPEGFSWTALLLAPLWAFYHRLWLTGLLILALGFVIDVGLRGLGADPLAAVVLIAAVQLYVGAAGNDLRRWRLERLGYHFAGVATGADAIAAEQRFFDRYFAATNPNEVP